MIEGIVGIFVILFLILVVPYIKDWHYKSYQPEDSSATYIRYQGVQYGTFKTKDKVINTAYYPGPMPPISPFQGMIWKDDKTNNLYIFTGEMWEVYIKFEQGDVWFW